MPRRAPTSLDTTTLARLLRRQDGVVSRGQLVELGATRADVRRLLARRELAPVHPGVYVDHSGTPTRRQREWAAVLACAPAALHKESALDAHGMTRDRGPTNRTIHVVVDRQRRIAPPSGVSVERVQDLATWVQDDGRPPRATFDFALLKAAGDCCQADAIALLSDAVHQGLTTAARLLRTIDRLPRLRQRALLRDVLADVAAGTRSVLEQRYLRDSVDRWADLQRDLDAALDDHVTLRPGWAQVLEPCRLATLVGAVLRRRGWTGSLRPCGPTCILDGGADGPT